MISTTLDSNTGRVLVVYPDTQQAYTVCVKDAIDWKEIHDYIIEENNIDDIPNRKIDCTSEMKCSPKRSVYEMSPAEADVLKNHPKVEWVLRSHLYNEYEIEQRKYDQEFDSHLTTDRFKYPVRNRRDSSSGGGNPGGVLDFTQWGLWRHSNKFNVFGPNQEVPSEVHYTLSGKNVDVVIMDTGVRWDHPEFLKPGVTSVPDPTACEDYTRVRDILIHGASEYNINWASEGLVAPGTGTLTNYKVNSALMMEKGYPSYPYSISYHGSHVAGTAAGNQFGHAFEGNIWTIACVDRSDCGWSNPSDGFDYIKVWHKNKPINPETGRRNPTVVNGSWGFRQFFTAANNYSATERGQSFQKAAMSSTACPSVYWMSTWGPYKQFTSVQTYGQSEADEVFADPDCKDIVWCFAAGNSDDKQEIPVGRDYDNTIDSGTMYYNDGYSNYYNRSGTPAFSHQDKEDAAIVVGSIDVTTQGGTDQERTSSFSNRGPAIDVWAGGSNILSPYASGYADPRNNSYFNYAISGTSMATPQVCGVMALYLEANPGATRAQARKWLFEHGSMEMPSAAFYDPYTSNSATDSNYWGNTYSLKSSRRRILYNPYANNGEASLSS